MTTQHFLNYIQWHCTVFAMA